MFQKILAAVDGHKTYVILIILAVVSFYNGTSGTLDLTALMSDPELLQTELILALVAAGRSALSKIGA